MGSNIGEIPFCASAAKLVSSAAADLAGSNSAYPARARRALQCRRRTAEAVTAPLASPAVELRNRFLRALVVAGMVALGITCCGQVSGQSLPSGDQASTIQGTVVNSLTHTPIARALVHSTDNRFAAMTDGEGRFEFTLPKAKTESEGSARGPALPPLRPAEPESLTLTARKPGFLENQGGPNWIQAYPGRETTISLTPEGLIVGRVTLSTGDPATGISLEILSKQIQDGRGLWVRRGMAEANSAGEFRFADLAPGTYKLFTHELLDTDPMVNVRGAQKYGFAPVYYPNAADFSSGGTIELAAGQTVQADLSLTHQPYYEVKIPVANTEAGGLNITVMVQGHPGPGYSLGYNGGAQKIEGLLPNGNYLVEGETFGQNSVSGSVNLKVAGAAAEGPAMTLVRNSSLSVNATEEFAETSGDGSSATGSDGKRTVSYGGRHAYLQVTAVPVDDFKQARSGFPHPPTGPNDNSVMIDDLPPGRYWLQVNSAMGYVAAVSAGAADLLHEPFTIAAGSNAPIEVKLRDDYAEIDGTIAGLTGEVAATGGTNRATGSPPAFIYCIPLPESAGIFKLTEASSDGKFQVQLAPGDYRLLVFPTRQRELAYRDAEAMRAYETKGQVVHLSAGQKTSLQVQVMASSE